LRTALLFIPDISGFTKFVSDTEVEHGRHVIAELLDAIIEADALDMTVSELEGDAVFFYRTGPLPDFDALVRQSKRTFQAFHAHLKSFESRRICTCGACSTAHALTLKFIAHAGPIELITVRGFEKPYGSDVIVAHRLLKNEVDEDEYLLVTKRVLGAGSEPPDPPEWSSVHEGSADIPDVGRIDYHYVRMGPLKAALPDPPPPPVLAPVAHPISSETYVARPVAEVYEIVSNLDLRRTWSRDVEDIRYEPNRVNRVGTKHSCVIGGALLEFDTITGDFGEGRVVYGERVLNSPLVDDLAAYYMLQAEDTGTRLRLELHYRPKPFPRLLLAPLFRYRFSRLAPRIVAAIKEAAEGGADERSELIEA
jgi:hypothetical protein